MMKSTSQMIRESRKIGEWHPGSWPASKTGTEHSQKEPQKQHKTLTQWPHQHTWLTRIRRWKGSLAWQFQLDPLLRHSAFGFILDSYWFMLWFLGKSTLTCNPLKAHRFCTLVPCSDPDPVWPLLSSLTLVPSANSRADDWPHQLSRLWKDAQ